MIQLIYALSGLLLLLHMVSCKTPVKSATEPDGSSFKYVHECVVWDNITRTLEAEPNVELQCMKNTECSGIDCDGTYKYGGIFSEFQDFTTQFCIGLVIEPCTSPTVVQIYVDIFEQDNTTTETMEVLTNSTEVSVNGASFDLMGSKAETILFINLNHTTLQNKPHIFLSVILRVRVETSIFGFKTEQFLDGMEVVIVKGMYIPVPQCDPRVGNHTHTHDKHKCAWVPTARKIDKRRIGTGKSCPGKSELNECGSREMCENHVCFCVPGYDFNNATRKCIPITASTEFDILDAVDTHQAGQKSNTVVIVCSVVGVLVLVAVVIATVLSVRAKRNRSRYSGRQLVLSEDDGGLDLEVEA